MPILEVLTWPDARLQTVAAPVDLVDDEVRGLIDDLFETLASQVGVGLAAPQVGVSRRVVVVDCQRAGPSFEPLAMVNPEIVVRLNEVLWDEGCLSLPGITAQIERAAVVTVAFTGRDGLRHLRTCEGLEAVCVQHEIDHLDGLLYVDRLGALERKATLNEYEDARVAAASSAAQVSGPGGDEEEVSG